MKRFGTAMEYFSNIDGFDSKHLVNGYPWRAIDRPGTIVIHVGGGLGTVSKALAALTRDIKFIVQDLAENVQVGTAH